MGGLVTTYASWHWVFFLNVPFSVAVFATIAVFVPNEPGHRMKRLDLQGFVLSSTSLVSLLYGMELAGQQDWSLVLAGGIICGGIVVGLLRAEGHLTGEHGFAVSDFQRAFVCAALLTLLPTIAYRRLPQDAGYSMAKR